MIWSFVKAPLEFNESIKKKEEEIMNWIRNAHWATRPKQDLKLNIGEQATISRK